MSFVDRRYTLPNPSRCVITFVVITPLYNRTMLTTNYVCSYDEYVRKMSRLILGLSFVDITPLQYANSMDGSAKRSLYCSISVTDEFCPSLRVIHFGEQVLL